MSTDIKIGSTFVVKKLFLEELGKIKITVKPLDSSPYIKFKNTKMFIKNMPLI